MTDNNNDTYGETIQKFRRRKGMTQDQLATKLKVSRRTVGLWERDIGGPTRQNRARLESVIGLKWQAVTSPDT